MKHCPRPERLDALEAYRAAHPHALEGAGAAAWDAFRDHESGVAYRATVDSLAAAQGGLCAYCEVRVSLHDSRMRQVEHVVAKEHGAGVALDPGNLALCCDGGTVRYLAPNLPARRIDVSCGQAKGSNSTLDPRTIPDELTVVTVADDGMLYAHPLRCARAGIEQARVTGAIETLKLNCERLRLARERLRAEAVMAITSTTENRDALVATMLGRDADGRLEAHWSVWYDLFVAAGWTPER